MDVSGLPEEVQAELDQAPAQGVDPDILLSISKAIAEKRDEAVSARKSSGIEAVWMAAEEAYLGMDEVNRHEFAGARWAKPTSLNGPLTEEDGSGGDDTQSTAFVRLTARYVDAGAAKLGEILLPPNDKAFSFSETPDPDLIDAKDDQRQVVDDATGKPLTRPARPEEATPAPSPAPPPPAAPNAPAPASAPGMGHNGGPPMEPPPQVPLTVADLAQEKIELARKKAKAAETKVYDWLVESRYNSNMRKVIRDSARIGSGVLKGPFPNAAQSMALRNAPGGFTIEVQRKVQPAVKKVSPWDIFPDPTCGEDIHNGDFIFEREFMSRRQVEKLKDQPGYIKDAIDLVLEQGPDHIGAAADNQAPEQARADKGGKKGRFQVWYYTGTLSASDMAAVRQAGGFNPGTTDDTPEVFAIVTMINNVVVKAAFNPLETGRFGYYVLPWQPREGHWAGTGVAEQISTPQRIVNASTRALLSNAGLSGGAQIVIDRSLVRPADGNWELTPNKIWYATGEGGQPLNVAEAMASFEVPNVTDQMLKIIEYGMKQGEESTSIPLITQGQTGPTTPETLGATQLQDSNANQLLRSIGYATDDYVTEPLVIRFYEWLLMDPMVEESCKGDFKIDAHGSITLVERAIQTRFLQQLLNLISNPATAKTLGADPRKGFKLSLQANCIDPAQLMHTPEELAKIDAAPPPPLPQVQVAQIRAQTDQQRMAQDAQGADADRQLEMHDITAKTQVDLQKMQTEERLQMLIYSNKFNVDIATVHAQLAQTTMKLATQKDLALAGHIMDHHKFHAAPGATLSTTEALAPPVQMPGRAAPGHAFDQSSSLPSGARRAPDGHHYIADMQRPGKYLAVVP